MGISRVADSASTSGGDAACASLGRSTGSKPRCGCCSVPRARQAATWGDGSFTPSASRLRRGSQLLSGSRRPRSAWPMRAPPVSRRWVSAVAALLAIDGIGDHLATTIVMRALRWPDAFPGSDRTLQRAVGASSASELYERAERWRPWRAYAALHLWMHEGERACA